MSLDHFVALRWPLRHHILAESSKPSVIGIIVCWVLAVIASGVYYLTNYAIMIRALTQQHTNIDDFCQCWENLRAETYHTLLQTQEDASKYLAEGLTAATLIGFVFLANVVIYIYIAKVVIQSIKQRYRRDDNVVRGTGHHSQPRLKQAKGVMATFLFLTFFIILWTPVLIIHGFIVTENKTNYSNPTTQDRMDVILAAISCCTALFDVSIYFVVANKTRLTRRLGLHCCKSKEASASTQQEETTQTAFTN